MAGFFTRPLHADSGDAARFYQSGGAFGYRDQLQDSLAFLFAAPQLTREQRAALRQAAIRGRRCSALVASDDRTRRAYSHLR